MSVPFVPEYSWLSRLRANAERSDALAQDERASSWAIDFGGARLNHGELVVAVERALRSLSELGFRRGEIVAILAPPSLAGICLLHAFLEAGIVMLPLNARLSEVELIEALASTRVKGLWVEKASGGSDSTEVARRNERVAQRSECELIEFLPTLDFQTGETGDRCGAPVIRRLLDAAGATGMKRVTGVAVAPGKAGARGESQGDDDRRVLLAKQRAALILRTSGTTGPPKSAVLSLSNLIASASASQALLDTRAEDRWLLCMPIFHIGGLSILVRSVLDGSSVVVHPQFEAERVAEALEAEGVTCVSLVATMLHRLIKTRGDHRAPASLRLLLLGGGPATQALLAQAEALGYPVAPTYGLTEAASQVATRPPSKSSPDPDDLAAGLEALPGVELRIARGQRTPQGVEGEIEVRGPNVMLGYLDAPDATAAVLREGWLATGDFGRMDEQGRLRVLDRRSDLILSGGENIYPAEIESVLAELPEVEEAAVVGRDDAEFGARPIAYIVLRAGDQGDVDALRLHCEARLARFKVPVAFIFRDALPRTVSGKLMRRAL